MTATMPSNVTRNGEHFPALVQMEVRVKECPRPEIVTTNGWGVRGEFPSDQVLTFYHDGFPVFMCAIVNLCYAKRVSQTQENIGFYQGAGVHAATEVLPRVVQ